MALILFYEKPGCINNTRQKVLLAAAGHTVQAKSLLTEQWTSDRLRTFFGGLPVAQWFNLSAPRIRDGELDYEDLTEGEALKLMLEDPLLIRRPLMEVDGKRRVGFDPDAVERWIGLKHAAAGQDLESCPRSHESEPCDVEEEAA